MWVTGEYAYPWQEKSPSQTVREGLFYLVSPEGFEPPAFWFVAKRSIQLSYGDTL